MVTVVLFADYGLLDHPVQRRRRDGPLLRRMGEAEMMEAVLIILGGSGLIFAADYVGNALGVALWRWWRRLRGPT